MTEPTSSSSSTTAAEAGHDVETQGKSPRQKQKKASHWELVFDQTHVTDEVLNWQYKGSGTEADPYVVEYIENDRRNPMLFSEVKKWTITILVAFVSIPSTRRSTSKQHAQSTFPQHVSLVASIL